MNITLHDLPIGDPFEGPVYGQRRKSKGIGMILGVVASVATMGAAAPMMASTMTFASQLAGGAMMAGGVLSGVGAISGNKKLAKIGGILSLAGGLGGLAAGTDFAQSLGGAFAKGSGAETMLGSFGDTFMKTANNISGGLGMGDIYKGMSAAPVDSLDPGTIDQAGAAAQMDAQALENAPGFLARASETAGGAAQPGGVLNLAGSDPIGNTFGMGAKGPIGVDPTTAATNNEVVSNTSRLATGTGTGVDSSVAAPKSKGILGGFFDDNKELLKMGGEFLSKGWQSDEQVAAIDAAIEKSGAEARRLNSMAEAQEMQNANSKVQIEILTANDPALDAKLAAAAAAGRQVGIIPNIGGGGVTQNPSASAFGQAQKVNPQQPVRVPTYAAPTP